MSIKIAPAPPPLTAPNPSLLPRIAFLPNQQPVLLIPNNYAGKVAFPLRVSPNNERQLQYIQPRPPGPPIGHDEAARGMREEGVIAENLPSTQQRREFLKRKIRERPSKQYLIRKHILLTDPLVEPFVGEKTHQLRKQAVVSNLNRKLKSRPGPLDLVTKKILQADAELEEAIKEGRLLFPSSRREIESPSPSTPQAPSPSVLLSSLRISKQETIREEEEARASQAYASHSDQGMDGEDSEDQGRARKYNRVEACIARINPQHHPYARVDAQQPSTLSKARLKGPDSKSGSEYTTTIPDNYEAMMKQQELLIEWPATHRTRLEGTVEGGPQSHPHQQPQEDGGESDSGETIPYGDDENQEEPTTKLTYRVYPEVPQEAPDSTVIVQSKNAPRCTNPNFRGPIFSLSDIKKTDLMQECRERGLKCGGDKTTIMQRLDGVKEEIIAKFKEEHRQRDAMENSPQISSERALSNTSSSSSPSTIIEDMAFEGGNGMTRLDESIASRRHSLPSNNPHQSIAKSLQPPTRHLSMSSGSHPPVAPTPSNISSLSFSQSQPGGQIERKIQMKTANGEIFYATLPSADDLPIPRDGKPIGCRIAVINGKPVLQFQQPSGPIETGTVGPAGLRDTLLFAQNGSGGQVTLGPQTVKERIRSNSLNRKASYPQSATECNSISSLLRSNSTATTLPVTVQRTPRTQSTSSTSSSTSRAKAHLALPREPSRKPSKSPQEPIASLPPPPPVKEPSVQPPEDEKKVEEVDVKEPDMKEMTDAEQVLAHVQAINKLLDKPCKMTVDAKTVLEHEQAIRGQQKLIDQLQRELKKSVTTLKMQQQLILSAKRAQTTEITKMTNAKLKSVGEAWLFELNMKRLHKSNSSFFLTHEQQEQELKAMTEEQKKIQKAHINIQMSEASDSAIKDITKFIGANPKTALLIVQLLKKYQNEKNLSAAAPTQTFADIPPFEPSEKTPKAVPTTIHDFTMAPGPSRTAPSKVPAGQDNNGNGDEQEAIVIDDDSQDEETPQQSVSLRLATPPTKNRRKETRTTSNYSQVDMEAIFRTVLDGSKSGKKARQQGSPLDSNMNKTIDHSPTHSVSSIPSSTSMAGIGPSDSSSSPCSSSTPPEMGPIQQAMTQPMHYNQNLYPVRAVSDPPMEYLSSSSSHPPYESSTSRPYVREGVAAIDDNATDILMEAVESSGIVDEMGGGDEPMPSSSHSMHQMHPDQMHHEDNGLIHDDNVLLHDHQMQMQMIHDDVHQMMHQMPVDHQDSAEQQQLQQMMMGGHEMLGDVMVADVGDDINDLFTDYTFNLIDIGNIDFNHATDINDVLDVINNDSREKPSPAEKKVRGNEPYGRVELEGLLGASFEDLTAPLSNEPLIHPMQLEVPTGSNQPVDNMFEDVFGPCSSSHVGRGSSQSTSSRRPLATPSPDLTDMMSWLNEDDVSNAFNFSPSNV